MEAERADGPSRLSKAEILRGIVADKLTAAAHEILAVVERTVAGYEEEVSGLRQELDRQRKQLELLLQHEIKLEITDDQFPVCEPAGGGGAAGGGGGAAGGGGGAAGVSEEEKQHKYELSVTDTWSLGPLCHTELQREEREEERPAPSSSPDQGLLTEPDHEVASRLLPRSGQSDRKKRGRPRTSELQDHVDLKIRILEDSQIQVLSASVFKKYPVQEVRCSRGLQEADFLDLLRSTFPQLAAQKPFDVFTSNRTKRLQPLRVERLTPDACRSTGHSALYIRLKDQTLARGEVQESEEERQESSSTSDPATLDTSSSTAQHGGAAGGAGGAAGGGGGRETNQSVMKAPDAGDAPLSCKVCSVLRRSFNMLIKHCWSHVDEPERRCGVCGEQEASAERLRTHLQNHQITHRCDICGKSFLSIGGLNGHAARHNGRKPHQCQICLKAFALKSSLSNHMWSHAEDGTLKCDVCQKPHVSKADLTRHMAYHVYERRYHCGVCGRSFMRPEHLSRHKWSHGCHAVTGRTFQCDTCSETFATKQKLLLHARNHHHEKPHGCSLCGKRYAYRSALVTHIKGHGGGV